MEKVCAGHSFLFASFAFSDWQFVARERVIAGFFPYRYGAGVDLRAGSGEWTLPVCPEPSAHLESRVWCGREDRGFPYLAIWTHEKKSDFICIEPWYGHADFEPGHDDFYTREGTMCLEPGETFETEYSYEAL